MHTILRTGLRTGLAGAIIGLVGCGTYGYPGYGYPAAGSGSPYGYGTPLPTYGNTIRCESNDGRARTCPVDTRGGVRLTRRLSDSACIQGQTWGYDARGIWVTRGCRAEFQVGHGQGGAYGVLGGGYGGAGTVRCESNDGRTRTCPVDTRGGVRLVRQLSDSPCIQGRSWSYDGRGIWVSQGCRADFEVGAGGGYGTPSYGVGGEVRCESEDNRRRTCPVRVRRSVTLQRQLSDSPCIRGQTWGWDRSGIWVDRGCRAVFSIR
ncbi:DUF3011 domain-containing protein [Luteimonas vadosa]|uniref:DUF3011 domain-containing protein n=1 Tax=Luteimonas vadosa TaxID=1165507 RepID=A0ABP9E6V3_9GAMM